MTLLKDEKFAELDQLNKDIDDFLNMVEWIQENAGETSVPGGFSSLKSNMNHVQKNIVNELQNHNILPGEANRDKQDFEHIFMKLQATLADEESGVMKQHLQSASDKIREQMIVVEDYTYSENMESAISSLRGVLKSAPDKP